MKKNYSRLVAIIAVFILFYMLNKYTPLYADDYSYSFSFATGEKITDFSQIFDSQIKHYYCMNGRTITHTLAQVFLLLGDRVFNIINPFAFIGLISLIGFHATGSFKKLSTSLFVVVTSLLFLSLPSFGQSFLWITGASNYLYGILIVLLFLVPYRLQCKNSYKPYSIIKEILYACAYLIFGIIAGWTNENTSVSLIVMTALYVVYYGIRDKKVHIWNITGVLGGIIGCILMIFSPGTASRLSSAGGSGGIYAYVQRIIFYTCDMINFFHLILGIIIVVGVICFGRYYVVGTREKIIQSINTVIGKILNNNYCIVVYCMGFLASVYSMIVSPQFPKRAWSGPCVLLLVIAGIAWNILENQKAIQRYIIIGMLSVLAITTYTKALFELKNINSYYGQRMAIIEQAIELNEKSVELPYIYGESGYSCYSPMGDLSGNNSEWPNTDIAKYYGLEQINAKK